MCAPLHFCGAVVAVQRLEQLGSDAWHRYRLQVQEAECQAGAGAEPAAEEELLTEEEARQNTVVNTARLAMLLQFVGGVVMMRRMTKSQNPWEVGCPEGQGGSHQQAFVCPACVFDCCSVLRY
ncbi:unnamed protein product [Prorocentrum cordatum]|uniref:Uncharacterized protein n=1 Tax=Prorocentrum cordatum TaxID=2364126 RepID=A0ABN9TGK8_9DINO|nr:unnamed protein product [Polarella glacialis]